MLDSIKQAILMLFFGTNTVITQTPINLDTGVTIVQAPKQIKPVADTLQVFIRLGSPNEQIKRQILTGEFPANDIGITNVEVCESETHCIATQYGGPFFSNNDYGLIYGISNKKIIGKIFSAVKIRTSKSAHGLTMRWQNYSK